MNPPFGPPRQIATQGDSLANQPDISKYTYSVADTVIAFREASMSITDRTIQRYCHSGKLRVLCVDPDTRQLTEKDNYIFLIDPTSIPERVAQLRESKNLLARQLSRLVTTRRKVSHLLKKHQRLKTCPVRMRMN